MYVSLVTDIKLQHGMKPGFRFKDMFLDFTISLI